MSSRLSHRLSLALDRDVLHAGAVALSACALSAGLVYVGYFVHVWRVAKRAPCEASHGECVLLFGKNAPQRHIDRDFAARLDRAVSLWPQTRPGSLVLLGGASRANAARPKSRATVCTRAVSTAKPRTCAGPTWARAGRG